MGELRAVRTRTCDSVSGMAVGSKIRTDAIFDTTFKSENLNASLSRGLCKKRSEFGYSFRIFSTIDGPVSSNLLAPPTKQTAILDRFNSSFLLLGDEIDGGETGFWVEPEKKDLRGAKVETRLKAVVAEEEEDRERKTSRDRGGRMRKTRRQSRSEAHFVKNIGLWWLLFNMTSFYRFCASSIL